jgi:hypothetical protein
MRRRAPFGSGTGAARSASLAYTGHYAAGPTSHVPFALGILFASAARSRTPARGPHGTTIHTSSPGSPVLVARRSDRGAARWWWRRRRRRGQVLRSVALLGIGALLGWFLIRLLGARAARVLGWFLVGLFGSRAARILRWFLVGLLGFCFAPVDVGFGAVVPPDVVRSVVAPHDPEPDDAGPGPGVLAPGSRTVRAPVDGPVDQHAASELECDRPADAGVVDDAPRGGSPRRVDAIPAAGE